MKFNLSNRKVDGEYGWIVVLMSFLIQMVADGINYAFGTLMVELLEEFDLSRSEVAITGSVLPGMIGITGPFAAALCDKYGCRVVVVAGAFVACIGLVVSTFTTNIAHMYISYGFITGIGLGLMYLPANACVIWYFNKYRGLANGIAVCGSGVGAFVFNNLGRYLIDKYGWRGFVLLEGGMGLQCTVFALLLVRPIREKRPSEIVKETEDQNETSIHDGSAVDAINPSGTYREEKENENIRKYEFNRNSTDKPRTSMKSKVERMESNGIVQFTKKITETSKSSSSNDNIDRNKEKYINTLTSFCQSLCSPDLLRDRRFWPILFSTAVIFLSFRVPMDFTADHAIQVGMSKYQASWLTSSVGIMSAVGRIFFGFLTDKPFVNRPMMLLTLLCFAGILTGFSFLLTTFTLRMIYTCLYGTLIGGYYMLLNVVLAEVFGTERIARSFGLLLFVIGISLSVSSPFSGFLYDKTGSYDVTFIVAGSELVVGGILTIISTHFCNRQRVTE